MGPSFKVRFVFFRIYGSREQCTGPSQKKRKRTVCCYPNPAKVQLVALMTQF